MATLLEKLDGLQHKFEEISMLITDPAVIADMKRYVRLNKEYSGIGKNPDCRESIQNRIGKH